MAKSFIKRQPMRFHEDDRGIRYRSFSVDTRTAGCMNRSKSLTQTFLRERRTFIFFQNEEQIHQQPVLLFPLSETLPQKIVFPWMNVLVNGWVAIHYFSNVLISERKP